MFEDTVLYIRSHKNAARSFDRGGFSGAQLQLCYEEGYVIVVLSKLIFIYFFIYLPRYSHSLGSKKKKLTERARPRPTLL